MPYINGPGYFNSHLLLMQFQFYANMVMSVKNL